MSRTITRNAITEALDMAKRYYKFVTVTELSEVLGISIVETMRCLEANAQSIRISDLDKGITLANGDVNSKTTTELRKWFEENISKGNKILEQQTRIQIEQQTSGRITYEQQHLTEAYAAVYLSESRDSNHHREQVAGTYNAQVSRLVTFLGSVRGTGGNVDKFLHGIPLNVAARAAIEDSGIFIYSHAETQRLMAAKVLPWNDYQVAGLKDVEFLSSVVPPAKMATETDVFEKKEPVRVVSRNVVEIKRQIQTVAGAPAPQSPVSPPKSIAEVTRPHVPAFETQRPLANTETSSTAASLLDQLLQSVPKPQDPV